MSIGRRTAFPPEEMTQSEEAATVGRYQQETEPTDPPYVESETLKPGRQAPPPRGVHHVRDPEEGRADGIRAAVARFEAVGAEVPEHLAALAADLSPDKEPELVPAKEAAEAAGVGVSTPDATLEPPVEEAEEVEEDEAEEESPEDEGVEAEDNYESWTVAELKEELDALGAEYDPKAHKADLIALLREAEAG